ncbi:ATP-dependent DNA ligase [Nafulsella turpanensis]|uniref:ATP-dependent DNA ligase n=1 Tax=Nafulsella turpanensis TaxID=1265690 RepID=UPI000344D3DD|nr:ATP-dependent DNA ligase [Nafulsella turpanensis]
MKQFASLFSRLDTTNKTNDKVQILKEYLEEAPDKDKLWALALFTHKRPKKPVNSTQLRTWAAEDARLTDWLFEESYQVVGDLSETIALLLPPPQEEQDQPLAWWVDYIREMDQLPEPEKKALILKAWRQMEPQERFVFNKLMSGAFRVGISQSLMVRAVSELLDIEATTIAHQLMGNWHPDSTTFHELFDKEDESADLSRPYPFFLAHALDGLPEKLGAPEEWQAEWKWDGIRSQFILREGVCFIWSRGEDLMTDKFPELQELAKALPDGTVIDGELLPFKEGNVLSFNALQTRIGRKNVTKKVMEEAPVIIFAYDLLEFKGKDIRNQPLKERRKLLETIIEEAKQPTLLRLSPVVDFTEWQQLTEAREQSRDILAEGLMLKRLSSSYQVGRKRGDWWKWKIDPLTIDGVLIYAQKGKGRRADLYTDYTFAVWDKEGQLVPFTKAYSGLTDQEIRQVDQFVKQNTRERFGPVRTVKPELVFEIAFEGIQESKRHKSGVALRFPRMLRWRHDKKAADANTLEELQEMLHIYG